MLLLNALSGNCSFSYSFPTKAPLQQAGHCWFLGLLVCSIAVLSAVSTEVVLVANTRAWHLPKYWRQARGKICWGFIQTFLAASQYKTGDCKAISSQSYSSGTPGHRIRFTVISK